MATARINLTVDENTKEEALKLFDKFGVDASTAVNMFIKAVLREQKIPFEVRANSFDENIYQKLKEAEQEINSTSKRYSSSEVLKGMNNIIG